ATSLRLAVLQRSDARLTSRRYEAHFSCSRPATTRLLLPNSCWPPDILLVVRSVKSARRSWLVRISGCSWEQPPSYILGPRSRAGSRPPDIVDHAPPRGGAASRGQSMPSILPALPGLHCRQGALRAPIRGVRWGGCSGAASGHATAAPPSSDMNLRRLMPDTRIPPPCRRQSVCRTLNLPQNGRQVL